MDVKCYVRNVVNKFYMSRIHYVVYPWKDLEVVSIDKAILNLTITK